VIDHVKGGGAKERRKKKFHNTQAFYNFLRRYITTAVVALLALQVSLQAQECGSGRGREQFHLVWSYTAEYREKHDYAGRPNPPQEDIRVVAQDSQGRHLDRWISADGSSQSQDRDPVAAEGILWNTSSTKAKVVRTPAPVAGRRSCWEGPSSRDSERHQSRDEPHVGWSKFSCAPAEQHQAQCRDACEAERRANALPPIEKGFPKCQPAEPGGTAEDLGIDVIQGVAAHGWARFLLGGTCGEVLTVSDIGHSTGLKWCDEWRPRQMSRVVVAQCVAILSLLPICAAQRLHPCKFSGTSGVGHIEGITVQRLAVIEKSGKVGATVFIPDGNELLSGIVFSHSAIHGPNNDTDLLRFAWALARAGAASIVLDGVIDWQSGPNDDSIRPPEFQFCAGQWLLQHVNIDLTRAADAGNHKVGWIDNDVSPCGIERSGQARCWPGGYWLDFGQIGQAESRNTDGMLTLKGQMFMAEAAQKYLKLKEVQPEWLTETPPFSQ
jgi:hypothetical protein